MTRNFHHNRKKKDQNNAQQKACTAVRNFLRTEREDTPEYEFDTEGLAVGCTAQQDGEFVKELQALAHRPTTSNVLKEETAELRKLKKTEMCLELPAALQYPPTFEVQLIDSNAHLKTALLHTFNIIRIAASDKISPTHNWTIEKQVNALGNGSGQAYQPCKPAGADGSTTHDVSATLARRLFIDRVKPEPEEMATNFLDIVNRSGYTFAPDAVAEVSLTALIRQRNFSGSWSSANASAAEASPEWVILTKGPSTSVWHADHAGYCTAVIGLEGEKFWYYPKGAWESVRHRFYANGSRSNDYPLGISVYQLGPGDCMIQAPGTPHAVVTPNDAMIAGCFFYTAAYFARSILCIRLHYEGKLHDNETIGERDFNELSLIMQNIDLDGLFTPEQLEDVFAEVQELLLSRQLIMENQGDTDSEDILVVCGQRPVLGDQADVHTNKKRRTRSSGETVVMDTRSALRIAEDRFLWTCVDWWSSRSRRVDL